MSVGVVGVGVDMGTGADMGMGAGVGMGADMGMGAGVGTSAGVDAGTGTDMSSRDVARAPRTVRAVAVCLALAGVPAALTGCTVQVHGRTTEPAPAAATSTAPADDRAPAAGSGSPGHSSGRSLGRSPGAPGAPSAARPAPAPAVLMSRGDSGSDVRELQARLRQVAWLFTGPTGRYDASTERAVKGFQGKRGLPRTGRTDTVTWRRLLRMTHEPGRWELYAMGGQPAAPPDRRCLKGRVLCVSKTSRTLRWMIDGRTVSVMDVRFGAAGTPTREGVFKVYWKSRHHVSTLYHSPMPYAMFFSGGEAVHYSADFAARGYAGNSHGCVNVRDRSKMAALYAQVRTGDKVVVYW